MMKTAFVLLVALLLNSCGVDTSSSSKEPTVTTNSGDVIDQNPIGGGDTISNGSGTSNSSGTSNGSNGSGSSGSSTEPLCDENSTFECKDATYDVHACDPTSYRVASDASYNGASLSENGSDFFEVRDQGLWIKSEHLEGSSADQDKTWVMLYYKPFPEPTSLKNQGYTSYVMDGVFYLTYDIAWSDGSINGLDNRLYVQSNKNSTPACFKVTLNNVDGKLIDVQKVYR